MQIQPFPPLALAKGIVLQTEALPYLMEETRELCDLLCGIGPLTFANLHAGEDKQSHSAGHC